MIKTYFVTAFRNLRRRPGYTAINFFGLFLALTCVILIAGWVQYQFSFDSFHKNFNKIYQLCAEVHWGEQPSVQPNIQAAVAPEMKKRYPEISDITRVNYTGGIVFKYKDKLFYEDQILLVDSAFFRIFTFPVLTGSEKSFFSNLHSILFTESMARKYFGDEDPVGKSIQFNEYEFTVAGIVKDAPYNSSLNFNFIVPFAFQKELEQNPNLDNDWDNWYLATFLTLKDKVDYKTFNSKIGALYGVYPQVKAGNKLLAYPFKDMRLRPPWINTTGIGLMGSIYIIIFIGLMILIVACINFMNLSTACFSSRAKDVGIRKTIGAKRKMLFNQFMLESLILSISGGAFAVLMAKILLPGFNWLINEHIELNLLEVPFLIFLVIVILLTGLIAGAYPSFYLSSFKPALTLKGIPGRRGKNNTRMGLVIIQFSVSIFLIVSTFFSIKQLKYLLNKDIGFNKDLVINIQLNNGKAYQTIKQELIKNPNVAYISGSNWWGFNDMSNTYGYDYAGKPAGFDILLTHQQVDYDYIETLGIPMVSGRSFSKDFKTDEKQGYILNEKAVKTFGIENPVGEPFTLWGNRGTIIGIMKDVNFRSLYNEIDPRILFITTEDFSNVLIKLKSEKNEGFSSLRKKIKNIEKDWNKVAPDIPFEFQLLDDLYNEVYNSVRINNRIFMVFAFIAIFISCIGLFGLALYATEQKTKEIGVRKVNGARISQMIAMLLTEFIRFVIIAFIITIPFAYLFTKMILTGYSYRTHMSWWIYGISGGIVLAIALLTVGLQSWKAARRNPVEALRYE